MTRASDDAKRAAAAHPPAVGCDGKVPFDSFEMADAVVNRKGRQERRRRSAYRCLHCGKWHVGGDAAGTRRRKKADFKRRKADV